jgi:uncharacterized protein
MSVRPAALTLALVLAPILIVAASRVHEPEPGHAGHAADETPSAEASVRAHDAPVGTLPVRGIGIVPSGYVEVDVATVGVDRVEQAPVVMLRDPVSGKIVPIWVGIAEAQAILSVLLAVQMPRPMTHDLLANVVRELGATIVDVAVKEIRGSTFHGEIRLRASGSDSIQVLDSRPSDALALALRTEAPIHVAEALLDHPPEVDFLAPEAAEQVVRILGLTVVAQTKPLRERFTLPAHRKGVVVVGAYGEAAQQGLRRGDLVVEVNGRTPELPMDFLEAVLGAWESVRITVWRDGREERVELKPVQAPGTRPSRQADRIRT